MRLMLCLATFALLSACAPASLSTNDARAAMKARMERPGEHGVKVQQIHKLELSDCTDADADGADTVTCLVRMDVSFDYDGTTQRDDDAVRIRFVREAGTWVAYPAEVGPAPESPPAQ